MGYFILYAYMHGFFLFKRRNLKDYHTKQKDTTIGSGRIIKFTMLCKEKALLLSLFMVLVHLHSTGGLFFSLKSYAFFSFIA